MKKMHKALKSFFCLLLSTLLLIGTVSAALAENITYNYVVKDNTTLNVRSDPSTSYASIGSLSGGTKVYVSETVYANGRNWGKITYNGKTAWICIDYCEKIENQTPVDPVITDELKVNWTVIDISQHQIPKELDWAKLKAAGVKGVIIRIGGTYVTSHKIYSDDQFKNHYDKATAAGMYVGVYFFSYALNKADALAEANFVTDTLKKYNCKLSMPVFIDIEDYSSGNFTDTQHRQAGTEACNTVVNTFCDTVKAAGYYPGIYCNLDYTRTVLSPSVFKGRAVWIAQWAKSCTYTGEYHMWQYTETGRIDGYNGNLDMSKCYLNFPKLISDGKTEDPVIPTPSPETEYYGDHPASDWKTTKQATCSEAGERIKVCTDKNCGITLVKETIQPSFASHKRSVSYVSLVDKDIKAGTVLSSNVQRYLHEATEKSTYGITYDEAYKTSGGVKLTFCKTCKTILTVSYSYGNGCAHSSVKSTVKSATCTSAGLETDICNSCGKLSATRYVSPLSHSEGSSSSTATCAADGTRTYYCSTCKTAVRSEFDEKTDHDFSGKKVVSRPSAYNGRLSAQINCANCSHYTVIDAKYGDPDNSGSISVADARSALRYSVALDTPTPMQSLASDIDFDNKVTVSDARFILRIAVGLDEAKKLYDTYNKA